MADDVFISYSRKDTAACDAVYAALLEFGVTVFLDRKSIGAGRWLTAIEAALTDPHPPVVVVLASGAAAASANVRQEIRWARDTSRDREVPVLVIELEPAARDLPGLELGEFEALDLSHRDLAGGLDEEAKDELWLRLHVRPATQSLADLRNRAQEWSSALLPHTVDFWGDLWQQYLPDGVAADASRVLTARGGAGKSVLIAHFVRHLLATDPRCYPVIIRPDALHGGMAEIARSVGARSPAVLGEHLARVRMRLDMRVVFVVDGLDLALTGGDQDEVVSAIRLLNAAAMLVATCRTEAWELFEPRLGLRSVPVRELTDAVVTQVLRSHTHLPRMDLAVLRLPLYLDAVVRLSDEFVSVPRTETDILRTLWQSYAAPAREPDPQAVPARRLLRLLAARQLAQMSYEVDLRTLDEPGTHEEEVLAGVAALERRGALVRRQVGAQTRIRLRHDLLDCFGMAQLLLEPTGGDEGRKRVYRRAEEDCGAPVLSVLVQVGADRSDQELIREVFGRLLAMLDEKRFGPRHMARAWAATRVLQDKFRIVLPLVLEVLAGERADSLPELLSGGRADAASDPGGPGVSRGDAVADPGGPGVSRGDSLPDQGRPGVSRGDAVADPGGPGVSRGDSLPEPDDPGASRAGPRARLTQEAASSLASAFAAMADWRAAEPDRAIPVLERGLHEWRYRRRFVEALGRYRHPEAVAALERFARLAVDSGGDPDILCEVATALGDLRQESSTEVLAAIAARPDLDVRTRRAAIQAKNSITWPRTEPLPEVEEAEVIENLNPTDRQGNYSDWRVIEEYARHARGVLAAGASPALVEALIAALRHDQTFAQIPVARSLGRADDPRARGALLAELRKRSLPAELRKACVSAVRDQLVAGESPAVRAVRANLVRVISSAARRDSLWVAADALDALAEQVQRRDGLAVSASAFELAAVRAGQRLVVRMAPAGLAPELDPEALALVAPADRARVGAAWEQKYRVCALPKAPSDRIDVWLTESSWPDGAGFHAALARQPIHSSTLHDTLLHRWVRGETSMPGLAAVHCVAISADDRVLVARRAPGGAYAPGRWSVSFEEQLTAVDLEPSGPACVGSGPGVPVAVGPGVVGSGPGVPVAVGPGVVGSDPAGQVTVGSGAVRHAGVGPVAAAPLAAAARGLREEFGGTSAVVVTDAEVVSVIMETGIMNVGLVAIVRLAGTHAEITSSWRAARDRTDAPEIVDIRWLPAEPEVLRRTVAEFGEPALHPTSAVRLSIVARWLEARSRANVASDQVPDAPPAEGRRQRQRPVGGHAEGGAE